MPLGEFFETTSFLKFHSFFFAKNPASFRFLHRPVNHLLLASCHSSAHTTSPQGFNRRATAAGHVIFAARRLLHSFYPFSYSAHHRLNAKDFLRTFVCSLLERFVYFYTIFVLDLTRVFAGCQSTC